MLIESNFKVSVIIPIYNNESYLKKCLQSVIDQTLQEIEIICVNDGSTDSSLNIINEFAEKDNRVVVIDKVNSGYGNSVNCGLDVARGEYIGIVESDDYIDAEMYEQLYATAKAQNAEIVKSNYWQHQDGTEDKYYEFFSGYDYGKKLTPYKEEFMLCSNINLWSGIYEKSFLEQNRIRLNETPGASYQDVSFTIKTMACADCVILLDSAFYHYRLDNPNSSVKSKAKVYCICDEFNEVWNYLNEREEIKERVKYIVPFIQFLRYRDTYRRIDSTYKPDFFVKMVVDFYELDNNGLLSEQYWTPFAWAIIHNVMGKSADKRNFDDIYAYQRMRYIAKGFQESFQSLSDIFIFGAGKVGQQVAGILEKFGIDFSGFLVSNLESNEEYVMGKEVQYYGDIVNDSKDITILVSVKDDDQIYVMRLLELEGISNVVSMNYELRMLLKKYIETNNEDESFVPKWLLKNEMEKLKW